MSHSRSSLSPPAHPHPVLLAPLLTLGIHLSLSSVSRASVLTSSTSWTASQLPDCYHLQPSLHSADVGLAHPPPGYPSPRMKSLLVPAWVCKPPSALSRQHLPHALLTYSFRRVHTGKGRPSQNSAEGTEHRKWGTKYGTLRKGDDEDSPREQPQQEHLPL